MGGDGTVGRASVPRRSARDDGAHLPTDERSFEMLQLHFRGRTAAAFSSDNFCRQFLPVSGFPCYLLILWQKGAWRYEKRNLSRSKRASPDCARPCRKTAAFGANRACENIFRLPLPRNPLKRLVSDDRIQGTPRQSKRQEGRFLRSWTVRLRSRRLFQIRVARPVATPPTLGPPSRRTGGVRRRGSNGRVLAPSRRPRRPRARPASRGAPHRPPSRSAR